MRNDKIKVTTQKYAPIYEPSVPNNIKNSISHSNHTHLISVFLFCQTVFRTHKKILFFLPHPKNGTYSHEANSSYQRFIRKTSKEWKMGVSNVRNIKCVKFDLYNWAHWGIDCIVMYTQWILFHKFLCSNVEQKIYIDRSGILYYNMLNVCISGCTAPWRKDTYIQSFMVEKGYFRVFICESFYETSEFWITWSLTLFDIHVKER